MALTDLIQIVDESDNPIGNETMGDARRKGLIHRIVRVMVEDSSGKVLLQKRTAKLLWPHCWDNSAAGHVDADEDYSTAAKRELFEELGIKAEKLEEIGTYFTDVVQGKNKLKRFNRLYKYVTEDAPKSVKNSEVAEIKWFSVNEVKNLIEHHPGQVTDGLVDVMSQYY